VASAFHTAIALCITSLLGTVVDCLSALAICSVEQFVFVVVTFQLGNALHAHQTLAFAEANQHHPLSVATKLAHLIHARAHQCALIGNQHQVFATEHLGGAHQRAVALVHHHADHTLGITALGG